MLPTGAANLAKNASAARKRQKRAGVGGGGIDECRTDGWEWIGLRGDEQGEYLNACTIELKGASARSCSLAFSVIAPLHVRRSPRGKADRAAGGVVIAFIIIWSNLKVWKDDNKCWLITPKEGQIFRIMISKPF